MKKKLSYIDSVHRSGTIWNISVMILLLAFPLTVAALFGAAPDWGALVVGLIATAPMYWAVGVIETVTFVPMLGAGGSYLSFVTGNISNLKLPCAINALEQNNVSANSEEGEIISTIAIATAGENDVILFFSYSGATKDLIQTISYARERGLRSILVTHFANSPGADLADVTLLCGANESPLQLGSVGARIAQMYLMDVLFSELCRRNLDECRQSRARIAAALAEKHL